MRSEPVLPQQTAIIGGYAILHRIWQRRPASAGAWFAVGQPLLEIADGPAGPQPPRAGRLPAPVLARGLERRRRRLSVAQHAEDVLEFIDQVAGGRADLVGHSRGGRVALEVALRRPDALRSLTLADPGLPLPGEDDLRGSFRQEALTLIRQGDVDTGLALFVDTVTGPNTWQRMVPWFRKWCATTSAPCSTGRRETARPDRRTNRWPGLAHPADRRRPQPAALPAVLDALSRWLPQARRIDIAGSSHGMNLGNPRAFNGAIDEFLNGLG